MLPQTKYSPDGQTVHEPINEIMVHSRTMQQLFLPVAESRVFTREDAARAFGPEMLSADERVPHPELVQRARDLHAGVSPAESQRRFEESAAASELVLNERVRRREEAVEKRVTSVEGERHEYRFTDINAERVGNGRARYMVGWRYGFPREDRKRGHSKKVPTSVG
jgi:hypothetical protein